MSTPEPFEADSSPESSPHQGLTLVLHLGEALVPDGRLPSGWREHLERVLGRVSSLYGVPVAIGEALASPYLDQRGYAVLIEGWVAGVGTLWPGHVLAVPSLELIGAQDLAGFPGIDPVTGYPSWWVRDDEVAHARSLGYWTAVAEGVLAGHLEAIACRVLTRR